MRKSSGGEKESKDKNVDIKEKKIKENLKKKRSKGVRHNSRRFTHIKKKKITAAAVGLFFS